MVDRFSPHRRIPSWNQQRLRDSTVLVVGRGWVGAFAVWALGSVGVGEILWLGEPWPLTERLARWFLADPCPFSGCSVFDYPFEIEYGQELRWVVGNRRVDVLIHGNEAPVPSALSALARERRLPLLVGTAAGGGWYGYRSAPHIEPGAQDPAAAMAVAALLADTARELRCPLAGGRVARAGPLGLDTPDPSRRGDILLVGVGGIGVYAAMLAAVLGYPMTIVDCDTVEASNLNRQGLYTAEDAACGAPKALAAKASLERLFPGARISALACRFDDKTAAELAGGAPSVILSAVDNARTRLSLQELASALGLGVVQGGTDLFLADCFTQEAGGPTLDAQMHGALSRACSTEAESRQRASCAVEPSYVVPGMMAGALMVHRMVQHLELRRGLPPIHWRAGSLPTEERTDGNAFTFSRPAS